MMSLTVLRFQYPAVAVILAARPVSAWIRFVFGGILPLTIVGILSLSSTR